MIAFDTETHLIPAVSINKRDITVDTLTPKLVCVSICDGQESVLLDAKMGTEALKRAFESKETFIGHNVAFDMAVIGNFLPELWPHIWEAYGDGRVLDTQVAEQLLNIAKGELVYREVPDEDSDKTINERVYYSLAALSERYLGITLDKEEDGPRLQYGALDGVPLEEWPTRPVEYAKRDAESTYKLFEKQSEQFPGLVEMDELKRQTRAAFALHMLSVRGIVSDKLAVNALKDRYMRQRVEGREALIANGLYRMVGKKNPKLTKDMAAIRARVVAAYMALGKPVPMTEPPKKRKSNEPHVSQVATDADTLEGSGDPLLQQLASLSSVDKVLDTYVPILEVAGDHSIHSRFKVLVNSGRTSSTAPNLQNMPQKLGVRECYKARDGYYLCSVDYSTLELCTLAQCCVWLFGESKMADAINDGRDLHLEFAAQVLGISYVDALRRKLDADVKKARQFGKVFNFGKPGGLQAKRMIEYAKNNYGIDMTYEEATKYERLWFKSFPEMRNYFDHIKKKVPGWGTTAVFKQFVSNRRRGGTGYTDGCNTYFQGLAADGAKAALWAVVHECYNVPTSPLYGSRPVAFVHDEIIVEVPIAGRTAAAYRVRDLMIEEMRKWVPDVRISTDTPALMRHWWKEATAVLVNGELEPWEPEEKSDDRRAA